ncbi:FIST N-terminal domain-containing protein [Arcobacteraceae bacterium]|nr:FIST N-terminal domain-containing protein [Arcobacteraceae bacterium]
MKTYNYTFKENTFIDEIDYSIFKNEPNILIQIFSGEDKNILGLLSKIFDENIPQAVCIGTTTDGEIHDEVISTLHSVISISVFHKTTLTAHLIEGYDCFNNGYNMAHKTLKDDTKLLITFTSGIDANAEEYLKGITSYDNNVIVSGGMAGDNGRFIETSVSLGTKVVTQGCVAVSLNSDVLQVNNGHKFDWVPIGLEHTIDKVEGNRIYSISGMNPSAFYKKYLGENVTQAEFPLIVKRSGISTARAVLMEHKDGTLSCAGNLRKGDIVRLSFGDAEAITGNSLRSFDKLIHYPIETFFIYSCMARRRYMGELIGVETKPFADVAPTAGFFSYAEFFHSNGHNELLNQTLTIVALSEQVEGNSVAKFNAQEYQKGEKETSFVKTLKSLTHLIQKSTKDYQEQSIVVENEKNYSHNLLASQKQFLKHAVHETNTPLSVIMGNIELYEMENGKNKYVTNIEVALKNLCSIYDDLSYLVKKNQIEYPKHKIDLRDYVRSRVDFFSQVAHKAKTQFVFAVSKEEMFISFNESKLQRIIDNTLTNAIKYSYENEEICIKLTKMTEGYSFLISSHSTMIQEPEKIFEEYYREELSQDGFGLGLNLVKRICSEENVTIDVNSTSDETSFEFIFKGQI